jgi:hypothetical protein
MTGTVLMTFSSALFSRMDRVRRNMGTMTRTLRMITIVDFFMSILSV